LVVRTNAQFQGETEFNNDIENLMNKWEKIKDGLPEPKAPRRLLSEMSRSFSLIRDMLNDSFERVVCDNAKLFDQLKTYLEDNAPQYSDKLELYRGLRPIFDEFDVSRQLKNSFGRNVTLKSGAYLVIEHTEALHVIDVNSGPKINTTLDQDTNAFNVNCEAALEVARQLRVRDLGGIIVIDFIDMKSSEFRVKVHQVLEEVMRSDRAKHSILPISKFGLMEITRQRVRSEIIIEDENEIHPSKVETIFPDEICKEIENEIASLKGYKEAGNKYNLVVHPLISAYLQKGWLPKKWQWLAQSGILIDILEDSSLTLNEFYVLNKQRDLIEK
jgi:ribonuclease G